MFPWQHIPGCERIGSLNLTGDFKVKGERRGGPTGAACESIITPAALINIQCTTHVWWSVWTRMYRHTLSHTLSHTHTSWFLAIKDKIDITVFLLLSISAWTLFPLLTSISHESTCNEHITVELIVERLPGQWLCFSLSDGHNVKWWGLSLKWSIPPRNVTAHQPDYSTFCGPCGNCLFDSNNTLTMISIETEWKYACTCTCAILKTAASPVLHFSHLWTI